MTGQWKQRTATTASEDYLAIPKGVREIASVFYLQLNKLKKNNLLVGRTVLNHLFHTALLPKISSACISRGFV